MVLDDEREALDIERREADVAMQARAIDLLLSPHYFPASSRPMILSCCHSSS